MLPAYGSGSREIIMNRRIAACPDPVREPAADRGTFLVALVALDERVGNAFRGREMVVLGLALVATLLGNWLLLRRFIPLTG